MTSNHKKIEIKDLPKVEKEQPIKPKKSWYFITFVRDFPKDRPYGFTLYDEPFVLFRDKAGKLTCFLLSSDREAKIPNHICVKSFPVMDKQGMIWFWRGKTDS